ncbi:MAG: mechanosensitive ion channel domain-containing protein [Planctomycetota bacterium]
MHRSPSSYRLLPACPRRSWRWLLGILALLLGASRPAAQDSAPEVLVEVTEEQVELSVANRAVFAFRGELAGYSPEERRASAEVRLARILKAGGALAISTRAAEGGTQILVDDELLLTVMPADARAPAGETQESLVSDVRARLATALAETVEARSLKAWLLAGAKALAATLAAALVLTLLWRAQRRLSPRIGALAHARSEKLASSDLRVLGQQNLALLARGAFLSLAWLVTLAVLFFWLEFTLLCFPYSRALGEGIGAELAQESAGLGAKLLASLPNLAVVLAIWLLARFVAGVVTRYFAAAQQGLVESRLAEAVTAPVAARIVVALVWLAALVISFPYIPGSGTQAFRGITVFAGLMLSLGSSSIVAQMASGILLAYARAFRVGDYVRVGEHEGTVVALGLLATKIHTTKNEELSVPNTVFTGGTTTNLSRLSQSSGVFLATKLTLGYDIPWRKVHELLVGAARKTEGLRAEPAPYVLQTSLSDFYVEYELRACLDVPRTRVSTLSRLHAQLLDDFQQAGLQILSPHFLKHGKMTGREGIEP